ncbi:MAG: hypothetical protein PHG90_02620 [Clostridia bacterium]|nr:hypothetical protein [Clostridia bacterium]
MRKMEVSMRRVEVSMRKVEVSMGKVEVSMGKVEVSLGRNLQENLVWESEIHIFVKNRVFVIAEINYYCILGGISKFRK